MTAVSARTRPTWLVFLLRTVMVLALVFVLLALSIFYAINTQSGTRFILDQLSTHTPITLNYQKGTLGGGIWVDNVNFHQDDISVHINQAYLKLGWRSVLARQVHLVDSHLDKLHITNHKPPSGEPFDYMTIATPVTLVVDNANVGEIGIFMATKTPFFLRNGHLKSATWQGSRIHTTGASIDIDDYAKVKNAVGSIDLSGDYAVNARANISVPIIHKAYFGDFDAHVKGSLKHTHGTAKGTYHGQPISGNFSVQSLEDGVPFSATLGFDTVTLPYAEEQNITLGNGTIQAQGTIDRIELIADTDLTAKDIPSGRYHGKGVVRHDGMDVSFLQAKTASGILTAKGDMSWKDEFELHATLDGNGYKVREILPIEYQDYQAYLPQTLTGTLGVDYYYLDKATNDTRFEFSLRQKDGERINASLSQSQNSTHAPWHIHADWQNIKRTTVPHLGDLDLPHGTAHIQLDEGQTHITTRATVNNLSVAPRGDYALTAQIDKGERIHLTAFDYQGVMGDLSGTGRIDLATTKSPLSWQFDLKTDRLIPNAYFDKPNQTPFDIITGTLNATGIMRETANSTIHDVQVKNTNLGATVGDNHLALIGAGTANVTMMGSDVRHLAVKFDGKADQDFIKTTPSDISVAVRGDLDKLSFDKLTIFNDIGKVSMAGDLTLSDGIAWDVKARLDDIDTTKIHAPLVATITGDLASRGRYTDRLHATSTQFDGQIRHPALPDGRLTLDVSGQDLAFDIKEFRHQSPAGMLTAKGKVNAQTLSTDITANMTNFNTGTWLKATQSDLTGGVRVQGEWGKNIKRLDVSELDITGVLNTQPITARGALQAELDLPDDLVGYFRSLKATPAPKSTDELLDFQKHLQSQARQTHQIFRRLHADDLHLQMGDNVLAMNGKEEKLTTTLNIKDLSQIINSARGSIKGGVMLVNDANALPTIYIDLNADEIRTANIIAQKMSVLGKIANLGNLPSQLAVNVSDIIALGRVVKSARLDFRGTQSDHKLAITTKNANIEARSQIQGNFDSSAMTYEGVMSDSRMQSRFGLITQRQPTEFHYHINQNALTIAPHCWQTAKAKLGDGGSICLQDTLSYTPTAGNVNVVVQNLDTSVLSPALPSDITWRSVLNGKVHATWQNNQNPAINAVLYSDNGKVGITQDDTGYVEMPYERISIIAKSLPTGLKLRTDITGAIGKGYADIIIDPYKANKPISGAMAVNDINLAVVRPFFPDLQTLTGTVDMAGGVGGTLSQPLFYGNAELSRGQIAIAGIPIHLKDINVHADIKGTNATLAGKFTGGEGKGDLTGQINWQNELQAKFGIAGEHLTISSPPLLTAEFSPDIEVIVRPLSQYVNIQGVISVPNATIRPPETTESIVSQSSDVSVIDRRMVGNINEILATVKPWSINANIGLDLGNDVVFRGFGAKLPLAGALHLTQVGRGAMTARGVVQVSRRTKIDGIGQNLELNYAQIRFNGDMLNPRLSIEGEKQIEGQTVGVRVKGTASAPEITVFNSAGLTEQQAMNALITGRISEPNDVQISEESFHSQVTNNLAAAGLNLGLSGTRGITNQIGNALGLESLTVDASGNSHDTSLNITGYISPDLYIRYGIGVFNAETQLSMRYQLTRRIYVEATKATENMVDMIYRWKF